MSERRDSEVDVAGDRQQRRRLRVLRIVPSGAANLQLGPQGVVDRIGEAVDETIDAVYQLRAALNALGESLPTDTGLVHTPLGIICAPDEPQCIALTVRGTRCANPVFDAPPWSDGVLAKLQEHAEGFPTQLCRVHRRRPPDRKVSPDWFIVAEFGMWSELLYL